MSIIDWFANLPPTSLEDNGLKMLIYLLVIYVLLTAIIVYLNTKSVRNAAPQVPSLELDLDTETSISTQIPPEERIAILNIEKSKYIAAQKALTDAHRKKEVSDKVFSRLSVRYASDLKQIEEEIEKTTREVEVSKLEQELKAMQGQYMKIKGEESAAPAAPAASAPSATPSAPAAPKPPMPSAPAAPKPPMPSAPAAPKPPMPSAPTAPKPPMPSAPTAPTVGKPAPAAPAPKPPMPSAPAAPATKPPVGTPSVPAPAAPTPKPPTPTTQEASDEGDLFAKSTSIAALRKEMLKELDRLKKFMREQQ